MITAPLKFEAVRDGGKTSKSKSNAPAAAPAPQEELFAVPGMEGPQTVPGRAFTGIARYNPAPGARNFVALAPKCGSHFPLMDVSMISQYAKERSEQIRELLNAEFGAGPLLILPSAGGEWMQMLRTAIFQAVTDGYAALEAGVPVAIPVGATAVPEEALNAKSK